MPIKYVPFIPEPVEGQAVLGNFNRILRYKGADDVSMTLQRGMPLYEMEKQETVGENADGNMVIRGECVSACAYLKEQGIQVDLVYIDPPFASGDLKSILDDVVIGDYAEFHAEEIAGGYAVAIDKFMSDRVLSKIAEFNQKAFLNSSAKKSYKPIEISEEGLELIEFLSLDCTATGGEWHSDSEIKIDKNGYVIVDGNKTKEFWDGYIRSTKKPLRLKIRNICGDETVWEV